MDRYKHKSVWIIGASQGIGRALTKKLDSLGCDLVLSSRSLTDLQELNQFLHREAQLFPLDVTHYDDFSLTTQYVLANKYFDYIFYFPGYYEPAPLEEMSLDIIDATLEVNFKSVVFLLKLLLPYLKQRQTCQLLVASSVAGYIGLPNSQPYAACKAAVINLMESLRAENPQCNLRIITPGFVKTRLTDKNTFSMPDLITPEQAADCIVSELSRSTFDIHFPKKISFALKICRLIPYRLYFYLMTKFMKR